MIINHSRYIDIQDRNELKRLRLVGITNADREALADGTKSAVVIYARYSSDMQREESIDAQIRYCKEEIERTGEYVLVGIYFDEALTGKFDTREDFQNMIADARQKKFDIIMVHKFNRFARNKFDSTVYKKKLRDIGIRVVSATQKIDDTPEGMMLESIIESMDEYYSANLAEEVIKGMRENALKGLTTGGRPPLGYLYNEDGKLVVDAKTAPLVRKIFKMYLEDGMGFHSIAVALNDEGYKSQTGNPFRAKTISDIIGNEKYIGVYTYAMRKEKIRIEDNHEPIIDKETFKMVQQLKKSTVKKKHGRGADYHLTGKIYCGECGSAYSGSGSKLSSNGRFRYHYYSCVRRKLKECSNGSVNKSKLERYIANYILNDILTDENIENIGNQMEAEIQSIMEESGMVSIPELNKEKDALNSKLDKLLDLYLDDKMTKETYNEKAEVLKKQVNGIERRIKSAQVDFSKLPTKNDVRNYLKSFRTSQDSEEIVKALLDTFIDKVIVMKDRIEVTYLIDPNNALYFLNSGGGNVTYDSPNVQLSTTKMHSTLTHKQLRNIDTENIDLNPDYISDTHTL